MAHKRLEEMPPNAQLDLHRSEPKQTETFADCAKDKGNCSRSCINLKALLLQKKIDQQREECSVAKLAI
eukprot:5652653-Amphidinium_carterae.1